MNNVFSMMTDGAWDGGVTNNVFSMMTDGAEWDRGLTNVRMAEGVC